MNVEFDSISWEVLMIQNRKEKVRREDTKNNINNYRSTSLTSGLD